MWQILLLTDSDGINHMTFCLTFQMDFLLEFQPRLGENFLYGLVGGGRGRMKIPLPELLLLLN